MRAIIIVALAGCASDKWSARPACAPEWDAEQFALECASRAPATLEGLAHCRRMMRRVCPLVPGFMHRAGTVPTPCSKAWLPEQRAVCGGGR